MPAFLARANRVNSRIDLFMWIPSVTEFARRPSPASKPQSLAFDGTTLWMGSRETRRLYAIDPVSWRAREEAEMPGVPWGMTWARDALVVIYGVGEDDDRVVQRYVPGSGFDGEPVRAPDGTGSQLGWDGDVLTISQWYNRRVLGVDASGAVIRAFDVPHGVCAQTVVDGRFYLVTTDDEETGEYWITRVDARGERPHVDDLAVVPFPARALAFDGERFWTNHREADEIVAFTLPEPA